MVRYQVLKNLYEIEKTIGCGGFAKVKLATHIATGERVAIKVMDKLALGEDLHRVKIELQALKTLSHHHICKLYQVIETETHFFLVIEYCPGGELFDHIVEKNRLNETESRKFFRQIVSAVAYLHSLGYVHRDLKPENILLSYDQSLKLIDFGLCARPEGGISNPLQTSCGSPTYAAPELVLGKQYLGPEVDIWALGVILFALLCGFLPFDDTNIESLYRKILDGRYLVPCWLSSGSRDLISSMLQSDPKNRITIKQLVSHPWITAGGLFDPVDPVPLLDVEDDEIIQVMATYRKISMIQMRTKLRKRSYDYDTATYLLLAERKRRGFPLRLYVQAGVRTRRSISPADGLFRPVNKQLQTLRQEAPASPVGVSTTESPRTPKAARCPEQNQQENCNRTPTVVRSAGGGNGGDTPYPVPAQRCFAEPRRPSTIRKAQKRIRSPHRDGSDGSPVPAKKIPGRPATPKTPITEKNSSTPKKGVFSSIEKSFNKMIYALTPIKKSDQQAGPLTLCANDLCCVSTTQSKDPEYVITELMRALQAAGIPCQRKRYAVRGKMTTPGPGAPKSCSFELEVCLLPDLSSPEDGQATPSVGVRRKRLKGDAWCYKKVCEQVLSLRFQKPATTVV